MQQRAWFPRNDDQAPVLKIEIDGRPVADPYEVTLYLRATGPKDIKPDDIPDDLKLKLGAKLVAVLTPVGLKESSVKGGVNDTEIVIERQLLKRNKLFTVSAIVDGDPSPEFAPDLADVEVAESDVTEVGTEPGLSGRRVGIALLFVGLTAMLVSGGSVAYLAARHSQQQQTRLETKSQDTLNSFSHQVNAITEALPNDPEAAQREAFRLQQYVAALEAQQRFGTGGVQKLPGSILPGMPPGAVPGTVPGMPPGAVPGTVLPGMPPGGVGIHPGIGSGGNPASPIVPSPVPPEPPCGTACVRPTP